MTTEPTSDEDSERNARLLASGDEAGSAPEDRKFRPDVQGLRAIAILVVVIFHIGVREMKGGFVGVDVFFVISGFVITGLLLRERSASGTTQFMAFYARRARRILPLALLVITVSLVASYMVVGHRYSVLVASDSRWTASFLGNFHFEAVSPTLFSHRPESPLGQLWSLAIEEQFYLVYPAFFVAIVLLARRGNFRRSLLIGLTAVVVVSFAISVATSKRGHLEAYYSLDARAWELAIGGALAAASAYLKKLPAKLAAAMTWVGIVGILYAAFDLRQSMPYPGDVAAIPVLSTALVIAGGTAVPKWGAEIVLSRWPFQWLGRLSYGWYLWHWPILVIAAERLHTGVLRQPLLNNALLAIVALGVAEITYRLVENPVRHLKLSADNPGLTIVFALLLVLSCVLFTYAF